MCLTRGVEPRAGGTACKYDGGAAHISTGGAASGDVRSPSRCQPCVDVGSAGHASSASVPAFSIGADIPRRGPRRLPRGGARKGAGSMLLLLFTDDVLLVDLLRAMPESVSLACAPCRLDELCSDVVECCAEFSKFTSLASAERGSERATGAFDPRQELDEDGGVLLTASSSSRLRSGACTLGLSGGALAASAVRADATPGMAARKALPAASILAALRVARAQRGGNGGHVL